MCAMAVTPIQDMINKYGIGAEVGRWITASDGLNAAGLDDFIFCMASESEASSIVDAAGVPTERKIQQTSRVRQAWSALRKARADAEKVKSRGLDDTDLDSLLTQPELDDIADHFYKRYRLVLPASVMPSDAVVSRLSKELSKRTLTLRDIWKVKSQSQLLRATRKKTVLGEGVEVMHPTAEDDGREPATLVTYLNKLYILMVGYATAGSTSRSGAPGTEARGADTCLYVEVPLDVALKYYFRVKRFAESCPYMRALSLVTSKDQAEREAWIDLYRGSTDTLGMVIKQAYQQREAVWQPPEPPAQGNQGNGNETPQKRKRASGGDQDQETPAKDKGTGKSKGKAKYVLKMKNGDKLCAAYQRNKCQNGADCKSGKHLCGIHLGKGRVCGMKHPACECTNRRAKA